MVTFHFREILFYLLSYLLGSIPFGFIFSKIFAKKNVLKVGWRKTSGSNVFKHVSKPLGILSGVLDVSKGSLAVYLAKYFGLSFFSQILCGVLAIFGHNWSIYLKFAGGRGVGTFLGALIFLDPKIFLYSIFPTLILLFLLNSPIATIFFFLFVASFSLLFQNEIVLLFSLFSLFPIFIKRLSPISEISLKNFELIKNRLLYDRDEIVKIRIQKWISKK
jgi:glycerol-3-phosphate acyltransferase PlsY